MRDYLDPSHARGILRGLEPIAAEIMNRHHLGNEMDALMGPMIGDDDDRAEGAELAAAAAAYCQRNGIPTEWLIATANRMDESANGRPPKPWMAAANSPCAIRACEELYWQQREELENSLADDTYSNR